MVLGHGAFGRGSGSIITNVDCVGTEGRLIDCDFVNYFPPCTHNENVSVRCCKSYG